MTTKKALLVGSSFSATPIFYALKDHGLHVSVCGNNPSDACHQYADASYFIDYSDPEHLLSVVESGDFDFLVPTCNDYSYMSCAKVAEKFSFPGFDSLPTATELHTKNLFRQLTQRLGIPAPRFTEINVGMQISDLSLDFPLLMKPVDSFSGRGMSKIFSETDLALAISDAQRYSRVGKVVVEEFLDASLHSHSAFLQKGTVQQDFFVDEFCTVYPYQVNCSNHPSLLTTNIKDSVREAINQISKSLGLVNGLIHTQFMVRENEFWIIETMRRCPGDLYGVLVTYSTGVDYADLFVRSFLDLPIPESPFKPNEVLYGRHTVSGTKSQTLMSIASNIPSVSSQFVSLKNSGEHLKEAPFDKAGILFVEFESQQQMEEVTPLMAGYVNINSYNININ
ncbi:ATP-grasp domain-containing protein [Methylophilus medardicus]|uniref:ATP-grasp domain-containing protein n=1 Tax=Methylophilus medardicus TaxID=2588534 RepID=A0A5B8CSK6_9PROT|nr:ATP-grasp domain-containing protein [Methylophilus medardicus]QDC44304.1 ATP-grasp domain-containing protein [Methylophilus medardicus]QDC49311.1 ATP-grasp domain-containing protein [Methylophilus medardicus]QDC53016.1 ATP-grasp domain-containing protein [Methylophilus medardicus]